VPCQECGSWLERLLIPLIHFILLGFLPVPAMRRTRWPAMSAGCGQLFIARRAGYQRAGGHAAVRRSLHDGIQLPRAFRRAGLRTELFDATDLATCRMYATGADTWRGLGRNATEGLAAPGAIVPMTVLLFGGQVLPFVLLGVGGLVGSSAVPVAAGAAVLAWLPRLVGAWRFGQPFVAAWLHPVGVVLLLAIQWQALGRRFAGRPAIWKGRRYVPAATGQAT
jgi:hypothetical protein